MTTPRRRLRCAGLVVVGALLLSACSGGADDADPDPPRAEQTETWSASPSPEAGDPVAQYVALGDSYTAAPGVPVTEEETGCSRSSGNYPNLVAAELGLSLVDVSCSGADTLALVGSQETSQAVVAPQFLALTPETELVTLGMGGNDEGLFRELVTTCLTVADDDLTGSPCRDTFGDANARERIEVIGTRLASAVEGIRNRAPQAEVVLVGYPQLVPESGRCDLLPLAAGDYAWIRDLTDTLNAAIEAAAEQTEAGYADVLAASRGRHVCAGDRAWVSGILPNPERPAAPLHPFAEEQEAVARLVVEALR